MDELYAQAMAELGLLNEMAEALAESASALVLAAEDAAALGAAVDSLEVEGGRDAA
jgi:hypothetical protein